MNWLREHLDIGAVLGALGVIGGWVAWLIRFGRKVETTAIKVASLEAQVTILDVARENHELRIQLAEQGRKVDEEHRGLVLQSIEGLRDDIKDLAQKVYEQKR